MTKEFNLSEKEIDIAPSGYGNHTEFVYPVKDVKEAVRLLKEIGKARKANGENMIVLTESELNKIMGEKLI